LPKVTKVTNSWTSLFLVVFCLVSGGRAQTAPLATLPKDAGALYRQLGNVGLDPARVYQVRGTEFNRGPLEISLNDGTIAFTQDVAGRVTGAFFEGDGEVLLAPPNQTERSSMALFTGAAILEERFVTAYFRFNDDSFSESNSTLRAADNSEQFFSQWNQTARNLAGADALRLLLSFSQYLPSQDSDQPQVPDTSDRMLHARLQGRKLGTFDLYFDSEAAEQIWAGQLRTVDNQTYYDVWTSFTVQQPGEHRTVNGITAEEGKTDTIAISRYKIRAEVSPPTTFNADATLEMEVRHGGQRAALFELSRFLEIRVLEADGHPVEFIHNPALEGTQLSRRGNDLVAVIFPRPLHTGQRIQLHFVYGGEVLSEAGGGLLYVGARGTWYPNRGLAMADYDLQFRYPPGWTLLATGKRVEQSAEKETPEALTPVERSPSQVSRWVSERPLPVAGFNLGKYSRAGAQAGNIPIESYASASVEKTFPKAKTEVLIPDVPNPANRQPPVIVTTPPAPVPSHNAQSVADKAARAVNSFSVWFGPYPYAHLALTQMPGNLSQGWPGLIFLSSISFLTREEQQQLHMNDSGAIESDLVVAHETAHEWWGDLIGWSGYRDQWLSEALANYSALMMLESESPAKFRILMDKYRNDLLEKNKDGAALLDAGAVTLGSRLSNSHFPNGYEAVSYGRGTWLLHMLRSMMRDGERRPGLADRAPQKDTAEEPFVRALRSLRERYQGKVITTHDLLEVMAEQLSPSLKYEGRKSLEWFFDGWVNGTAVPRFELQAVKYLDKSGSTLITGMVLQKDVPKDMVSSVPVYATVNSRAVFLGRVFAEGPETPFRFSAPTGARKVILDPAQTLLSRPR